MRLPGSGLPSKSHGSVGSWRKFKAKNSGSNNIRFLKNFTWLIAVGILQYLYTLLHFPVSLAAGLGPRDYFGQKTEQK